MAVKAHAQGAGTAAAPAQSGDAAAPADAGLVSFVVIAYNEEAGIRQTLESILEQVHDAEIEVLVVDDGSADATRTIVAALAQRDPRVRLIALERNRGRGFARRAGVQAATGRFIATVDADIVLPPNWLARCVREIADVDAVGGTAIPDGDAAYPYRRFALEPRRTTHSVEVTGSNALFRADVFRTVGFDPTLKEGEDVAINHALTAAGVRLRTVPGLIVRHEEVKSLPQSLLWMFQTGRGAERQLRNYRQLRMPDLTFFAFIALVAFGLSGAAGRRPRRMLAPAAYLHLVAAGHIGRAFVFRPARTRAFSAAIVTDALHMLCYFLGRIAGPPPPAGAADADL